MFLEKKTQLSTLINLFQLYNKMHANTGKYLSQDGILQTELTSLDEGRCWSSKIFHFLFGRETLLD